MTRITKMGGRKAPHKATDFFADSAPAEDVKVAVPVESQQLTPTASQPASLPSEPQPTPTTSSQPPATSKSMQSRLKLLRLKIKKTTSVEKQNSLRAEMRTLEKRIREENGRQGGAGAMETSGMKRKRSEENESWKAETNPWKRMEAERRSRTLHSNATDERREKRAAQRASSQRCFACRAMGHSARECPENLNSNSTSLGSADGAVKGAQAVGICFRCGSTEHTLRLCKKSKKRNEDGSEKLKYATCFVCSQVGHLSSQCPQNAQRGIYPEGGSCKVCSSIHHLVKDCPENKAPRMKNEDEYAPAKVASVPAQPAGPAKKVVSF